MNKFIPILAALAIIVTSGCIPLSINPIYKDGDSIYDPALLGKWQREGSQITWHFADYYEHAERYGVVFSEYEGADTTYFDAHLVSIDDHLFLDLEANDTDWDADEIPYFAGMHYMRLHSFYLVEQIEPTLIVREMNYDWFLNYLEENPDSISHARVTEYDEEDQAASSLSVLLTASTEELQAFIVEHINTEGAYYEQPEDFVRISD